MRVWFLLLFCSLLLSLEGQRLFFMTEAINQQDLPWATAVGGFFRCLLHLPFASGIRRLAQRSVWCHLPWGVSLQNRFSLALELMFLRKFVGKPIGSTWILSFPSEHGQFSLFLGKKKEKQLVFLPVCVACPSKSSSKLVLAFSSILVAGVGDAASSKKRMVNNRIEKGWTYSRYSAVCNSLQLLAICGDRDTHDNCRASHPHRLIKSK